MTNINDIYLFINFVTDKVRDGYVSPTEVAMALDVGQQALYKKYKPLKEAGDDEADTALNPFKVAPLAATSTATGLLAFPADYGNTEGLFERKNNRKQTFTTVLNEELEDALSSVLYPIASYPRYQERGNGVQLYPTVTHVTEWHYLSRPTTPVIAGVVVGNVFTYDPVASVQLQFDDNYWMDIIELSLPFIGVNLSSQEVSSLYQLAQEGGAVPR